MPQLRHNRHVRTALDDEGENRTLRTATTLLAAAALATMTAHSHAALNWEGQTGVFLNPLAYTAAEGTHEVSGHFISVDSAGSVKSLSYTAGLKGNVELGYTRVFTDVAGVNDQNIVHAKWQFLPERDETPAVAVWALYRDAESGGSGTDFGVAATKIVMAGDKPLVLDLGVRYTDASGHGLFGFTGDEKLKLEGSIAYFVLPNLAVGAEFRQQPGTRTWKDLAVRYVVNEHLNIDVGLADLGPTIDNQLALGFTYAW